MAFLIESQIILVWDFSHSLDPFGHLAFGYIHCAV